MARKPARLERIGALTPRDRMWAAMRDFGDFSPAEIVAATGLDPLAVIRYFKGLASAQPPYLQLVASRPARRPRRDLCRYALARDVGVDAPNVSPGGIPIKVGAANEQMWVAMRAMREFDYLELAMTASTPEHPVKPESAKKYAYCLMLAGYLHIARDAAGRAKARYRFNKARNTGPRAPLVCADRSVMDANTGAIWQAAK